MGGLLFIGIGRSYAILLCRMVNKLLSKNVPVLVYVFALYYREVSFSVFEHLQTHNKP